MTGEPRHAAGFIDPTKVTPERISYFNEKYPGRADRIDELCQHSRIELATYVRELVVGIPPREERPRWKIYGWSIMPLGHYVSWTKWMLVWRILEMERHDDMRVTGGQFYVKDPKTQEVMDVVNHVKPRKPEKIDNVSEETGAGEVKRFDAALESAKKRGSISQDLASRSKAEINSYDLGFKVGSGEISNIPNPFQVESNEWLRFERGKQSGKKSCMLR